MNEPRPEHTDPPARYRVEIKRCIVASCGGELAQIASYERNNWVTVEFQCGTCKRRFVVKVEL